MLNLIPHNKPHFFLVFPNIFGFKGGIQIYSTFLLKALQTLYPDAEYDVFLKYDRQPNSTLEFLPQTRFHCFGRWPRWIQNILLASKLVGLGLLQRPGLVISTHINYCPACDWLWRLAGVSYWVVAHGLEVWNIQDAILRKCLRHAERVVAVSGYTRNRLLKEQPLEPIHISVLPNTFDAKRFEIAPKPQYLMQRYRLTPEQPVILTVTRLGRSAQYKGYDQILEALVKVRRYIPNVRYILVGKGDDRPRIESLVERLNLQSAVTLAGFVPDEELADYYNLCDVFALPSQGEGFGIVYLEALACGKPVLAGNGDGAVDPLLEGQLGCLVNPTDVDAISDNLIQILQGSYRNRIIYQPQVLRGLTIEKFELAQFQQNLAELIGV